MKEEILVIENAAISKSNHPVITELYLQLYKQEIFGIIFDNILERKCLLDFLKGNVTLSSGRLYLGNEKIDRKDSPKYFERTIAVIDKIGKLILSFSVMENILMFTPYSGEIFVSRKQQNQMLKKLNEQFGLKLQADKTAVSLSAKERVIVELVKAFAEGKKLVVLTDISGFVKSTELAEIFSIIERMQELGMTFILIESFDDIVFERTDRLAVIQNGKTVGIYKSENIKRQQIYSALIGDQNKNPISGFTSLKMEDAEELHPVLEMVHVDTDVLNNINFSVAKGEVLKIYYMDDLSCKHITDLLKGECKPDIGRILHFEKEFTAGSITQAIDQGVCFVEESPYDNMLLSDMSVLDNLCLTLSKKVPLIWMKTRYLKSIRQSIADFFDHDVSKVKLTELSPIELQKIVYLKWLLYAPSVIVCIKPFTEVDIHLREVTVQMMEAVKRRGIAIIILTPNLSDVNRIDGDTIYMKNGRIIEEDDVYQILYGER